jgi:hypothetical protein
VLALVAQELEPAAARHLEVDDRELRRVGASERDGLVGAAGGAHVEPALAQRAGEALTQRDVVVHEQDARLRVLRLGGGLGDRGVVHGASPM